MSIAVERRLATATKAAQEAGRLVQHIRNDGLTVYEKGVQDFVTQADRASEDLLRHTLLEAFPEDGFLGEEDGFREGAAQAGMWVVDPVDGTTNFALGQDYWCVSIAWVVDGRTELGIVHAPDRKETFVARRGMGATLNGRRLSLPRLTDPSRAIIGVGRSDRRPRADHLRLIASLLDAGYEYRRPGAGALNIAQVAAGWFAAYYEEHMNSWDALAGLLIVGEAGGWTQEFLANDGLRHGNEVRACAPGMAPFLEAVVKNAHDGGAHDASPSPAA